MYYSIDSSNGTELCSGLSKWDVGAAAQRHANNTGDTVHVYASDGSEEYDVEPDVATDDEPEDVAYGYTFDRWLRAAGRSDSASEYDLRAAWRAGESPEEYAL